MRRPRTDQITDHDETGGDADAHLQRLAQAERGDRLDNRETAAHGALGIILMRQRVAEISQHAVAHQSGDKATIAGHYLGDAAMIGGDDVVQVLWIEPYGQFSRANEVAEHDRELAALGLGGGGGGCGSNGRRFSCGWTITECGDSVEQAAAVANRRNSELAQILRRQPT